MIIFMSEASIDLGYDINRQTKFVYRIKGDFVLGGFECTYNRRSQMIYKTQNCNKAHFIRKKHWMNLNKDFPYFFEVMKRNCLWFYIKKFRRPVNIQKEIDIQNFDKRADYGQVVVLKGDMLESNEVNDIVDKEYDRNHEDLENEHNNVIQDIQNIDKRLQQY